MFSPTDLPPALLPVLAAVRSWADDESGFRDVGAEGRAAWLAGLRQLADATEAAFARALALFDAGGEGEVLHGASSTQAWLRGALRVSAPEAGQQVRIARGSRSLLAEPLRGLAAGEVTYEQVKAIERTVHRLPDASTATAAVALLTDLARAADVTAVRTAGQRIAMTVDPDGSLAQVDKDFTRRHLHLSPMLDGLVGLEGLLDAEAAATVGQALAPFLVPAGDDDTRTAAQRRADGLVELARAAVAAEAVPTLSATPANLTVVVPLATLTGDGHEPAELPDHPTGPALLHPSHVLRLACDAQVTRIVLEPDGIPLDLGRTTRVFTAGQRRALALRDGGCRFPDCHRPARYTDAHHLVHWVDGGTTDLGNGHLLCRHHHRLIHRPGWSTAPDDPARGANGRLWFIDPGGRRRPSDPRGP